MPKSKDKIIEFKVKDNDMYVSDETYRINENESGFYNDVYISLEEIIQKILPELKKEYEEWDNHNEPFNFIEFLEQKYNKK